MANRSRSLILAYTAAGLLLTSSVGAVAQKAPPEPKTISDSINYIWKDVEHDFTALAEAMPEDKWSFKPTQGEFKNVRTFAEQVKHVACGNEAWAKQMSGEKPPARCDLGGPNPAKSKAEILAYLKESFKAIDKVIETAKKRGKASGIHIGNIEAIKKLRAKGMTVLACNTDIGFQYAAAKSTLEEIKR